MEAKELQIGDWVKLCNKKGEWLDYSQVDLNLLNREEEGVVIFKPVPLTQKILEKNGFTKFESIEAKYELRMDNNNTGIFIIIFDDGDIVVDIEKEIPNGVNRLHHCEIKYLHQLQQAMRLCGIEKEIKP